MNKKALSSLKAAAATAALAIICFSTAHGQNESPGDSSAKSPNRARWARVLASSRRLARMNEMARGSSITEGVFQTIPQTRPRMDERYAIDGSPLTFWASEESDLHWIRLELGNRMRERINLSGMEIDWGKDFPSSYKIMVTCDGDYWRPLHSSDAVTGKPETIDFNPPLAVNSIRVEAALDKPASISIVDLAVLGDSGSEAPAAPEGLEAAPAGDGAISLKWSAPEGEAPYLYLLYRNEGGPPRISPEFLVAEVDRFSILDRGLEPGQEYHYLLVAESFGGARSEPVPAMTSTLPGEAEARFEARGVIEGFYNDPWPHQERLRMISFMEDAGFNRYLYAPKMDPYLRQWWRRPYPEKELENFKELLNACKARQITFIYGLSPGIDLNPRDPAEAAAVEQKLDTLYGVGVRNFALLFDDVPAAGTGIQNLAEGQARLVNDVLRWFSIKEEKVRFIFVPTVFSRSFSMFLTRDSSRAAYLEAIKSVHPEVTVMWTGPGEVFSSKADREAIRDLKETLGRQIMIWDNYPANDGVLRFNIFTGPYLGGSEDLEKDVSGIFLNPMYLPNASKISLYTAGEYMTSASYDPWASYEEGLKILGGETGYAPLKAISDCLISHPAIESLSVEQTPVYQAVQAYWEERRRGNGKEARKKLAVLLDLYAKNPEELESKVDDPRLVDELRPASQKLSYYGRAGLLCLEVLENPLPEVSAAKRTEIIELQTRARVIPWLVADERADITYSLIGIRSGSRNVLDDFITRSLRELPR